MGDAEDRILRRQRARLPDDLPLVDRQLSMGTASAQATGGASSVASSSAANLLGMYVNIHTKNTYPRAKYILFKVLFEQIHKYKNLFIWRIVTFLREFLMTYALSFGGSKAFNHSISMNSIALGPLCPLKISYNIMKLL